MAMPNALTGTVTADVSLTAYDAWGRIFSTTDALGRFAMSRTAPGEIVQAQALDAFPNPPGVLAASDRTID